MIIRRKHNKNFTIIPNGIWDDEALTIEAKGALGYLLSRPDDWNVHLGALGRKLGLGKNKTQALVRQLISAGYMVRLKQKRIGPQQFAKCEYVVFDAPETRAEFMTEKGLEEARIVRLSEPEKSNQHEPQPQNGATVIPLEKRCDISAAALVTVAPNQGRILRTDLTRACRHLGDLQIV